MESNLVRSSNTESRPGEETLHDVIDAAAHIFAGFRHADVLESELCLTLQLSTLQNLKRIVRIVSIVLVIPLGRVSNLVNILILDSAGGVPVQTGQINAEAVSCFPVDGDSHVFPNIGIGKNHGDVHALLIGINAAPLNVVSGIIRVMYGARGVYIVVNVIIAHLR